MSQRENWLQRIKAVSERGRIPIIAEIKAYSPLFGDLLSGRSCAEIAKAYEAGGAACLSVVTGRWFKGNPAMLAEIAAASSLPMLRKDFVINQQGLEQSKSLGAGAVLLTRKLFKTDQLNQLIHQCLALDLTPFIEIGDVKELEGLDIGPESIIALTNRDIAKKETDTESGLKSLTQIKAVKSNCGAVVSASGITCQAEANTLFAAGFQALLVGTSLMQAENPEHALRTMSQMTVPKSEASVV